MKNLNSGKLSATLFFLAVAIGGKAQAHDALYETYAISLLHKQMHCHISGGIFVVPNPYRKGKYSWICEIEGVVSNKLISENSIKHQTVCDYLYESVNREYSCDFEMIPIGDGQ